MVVDYCQRHCWDRWVREQNRLRDWNMDCYFRGLTLTHQLFFPVQVEYPEMLVIQLEPDFGSLSVLAKMDGWKTHQKTCDLLHFASGDPKVNWITLGKYRLEFCHEVFCSSIYINFRKKNNIKDTILRCGGSL